jgi:nicotinate-nucleotide pyrophosphorylase (carboxylating)
MDCGIIKGDKMDLLKKNNKYIDQVIDMALAEDIGPGDVTTDIVIPESAILNGIFRAKDDGVICGIPLMKKVFVNLDKGIKITLKKKDGEKVKKGDIIATIKGKARAILMGERLALNLLQLMSGIATSANRFQSIAKPYGVTILDTRKTTPMLRVIEKYAVHTGGATNHRMGLYDMVLIKDNHLDFIDLQKAVSDCRRFIPKGMKIEVEVHNFEMLELAMKAEPDIIMLDNMNYEMLDRALARMKQYGCRAKVEVSGGVNLSNIEEYAKRRVDYISIGSITHSPEALDISLQLSK